MLEVLREQLPIEEFDYQTLMNALKDYKQPRDKVTRLLKSGDLIRVKKGLYVFGPRFRRSPFSLEVLANLIYGPSCLSHEYALSFHGLIPMRVEWVTSITPIKKKIFHTPIAKFSYTYMHPKKYSIGIQHVRLDEQRHCLIACKEKALIDTLISRYDVRDRTSLQDFLTSYLHMDSKTLKTLSIRKVEQIKRVYKDKHCDLLIQFLGNFS